MYAIRSYYDLIEVVEVAPYPFLSLPPIQPGDYRVTLKVSLIGVSSARAEMTKTFIPTGGVIKPSSTTISARMSYNFV